MKKSVTIVVCAAILLPLLFTSCKKEQEGVYNPKKKIEKIYTEWHYSSQEDDEQINVGKYLSEVWDWNGDKLTSITFYNDDASYMTTWSFSYDGSRISNISNGVISYLFNYENNHIVSIQTIIDEDKSIYSTLKFTHTKDKITRMEETYNQSDYKVSSILPFSPLRFILPSLNMDQSISSRFEKGNTKSQIERRIWELEWENNNIKKVKTTDYSNDITYHAFFEFTFDTKENPFYSSCMGSDNYYGGREIINIYANYYPMITSKNNIITAQSRDSDSFDYTENYTYTYEGKYPIVQEKNLTSCTVQGEVMDWVQREVVYYEYK